MSADNQDAEMYCGDDLSITIAITDESGAPLSLVGMTPKWTLAQYAGGTAVLTKTTGSGIVITDQANGVLTVSITHTDSAPILPGDYWHQLVVTDSSGNISTVATGTVTFIGRS